jgi:hypothetical protein
MPRPKAKVISALKTKGFVEEPGDHIILVYYTASGKKTTARTMTSHSPKMKDISDPLITQMARQCKLSKSDFLALVDCPMTREKFEQALENLGEI